MEIHSTEEQQIEAVKKFWKDNGVAIIAGAVLGLGGLWGWRYYNDQKIESQEQAAEQYQQVIDKLADDTGFGGAQDYVKNSGDDAYAVLAALQVASEAVKREDLDLAASQLQIAAEKASVDALKAIANIRLARVQIQQEKLDAALTTLATVTSEKFKGQVEELKGDAYRLQGNVDKARAAYSAALEESEGNSLLQMKLDNLSVLVKR